MAKQVKISFVGDIMCRKEQNKVSRQKDGSYDYSKVFSNVKDFFAKSDYNVGNLETPIAGEQLKYSYMPYSFNTPYEFIEAVKDTGFSLVSTANNHCLDRGIDGLINTIKSLDSCGIEHVGTYINKESSKVDFIKEINGIKFAILSYTYGTNSCANGIRLSRSNNYMVNLFRKQEWKIDKRNVLLRLKLKLFKDYFRFFSSRPYLHALKKRVKTIKKDGKADYIIMCMHSGGQYNDIPEPYTRKLMKFLIQNGIDFVIGCHPHVVHPCVLYKTNQVGAYSLGNFYSTPNGNPAQKDVYADYSIILNLYFDENKHFYDITFTVARTIMDESGYSKVFLVNDLIKTAKDCDKERLKQEMKVIIERFLNKKINSFKVKEEYSLIYDFNFKKDNVL